MDGCHAFVKLQPHTLGYYHVCILENKGGHELSSASLFLVGRQTSKRGLLGREVQKRLDDSAPLELEVMK